MFQWPWNSVPQTSTKGIPMAPVSLPNEHSGPALFDLGSICSTPAALDAVLPQEIAVAISRHARGDWGDLDPHDKAENKLVLKEGNRLLSAYQTVSGTRF